MAKLEHFSGKSPELGTLTKIINLRNPNKDQLFAALSGGTHFHIWVEAVEEDSLENSGKWEFKYTEVWQGAATAEKFARLLETGRVIPVGFNKQNQLWYLIRNQ